MAAVASLGLGVVLGWDEGSTRGRATRSSWWLPGAPRCVDLGEAMIGLVIYGLVNVGMLVLGFWWGGLDQEIGLCEAALWGRSTP